MSIAQEITRIKNCKTLIREAIVEKGVAVPENDLLDKYPDYIKEIKAGGPDIKLQEKTVTIIDNGQQRILPDEGYALSGVTVNAAIVGEASALDFTVIGYSTELSTELNTEFNSDIMYSRSLYNAWVPGDSFNHLFEKDTKLIYAPHVDISKETALSYMFDGCINLKVVPLYDIPSGVTTMSYMFRNCDSLTSIPLFDTSNVQSFTGMFNYCKKLLSVPCFDMSNAKDLAYMFSECDSLTTVPHFDTSGVTDMSFMFTNCDSLTTVPHFDTSNVTDMRHMFNNCPKLTTVPAFDTSNVTNMSAMFQSCTGLTSLPEFDCTNLTNISELLGYSTMRNLTEMGGFKNLKVSWTSYGSPSYCPNLTHQSLLNILNGLYDFTGNGEAGGKTISLGSTNLAKLTDEEKAISTSKGWILS